MEKRKLIYNLNRLIKRLTSGKRKFFYLFCLTLILLTFLIDSLINSTTICINLFVHPKINKICLDYENGLISGNFCGKLCDQNEIKNIKCSTSKSSTDTSLFMGLWKNQFIVFKVPKELNAAETSKILWTDKDNIQRYPMDKEFTKIIQQAIYLKYNITMSIDKISYVLQLNNNISYFVRNKLNHVIDTWKLVQDNDYMMAKLYEDKEIFPHIYGTCGHIYFTEYLEPLLQGNGNDLLSTFDWKSRIKSAVLILDYLKEIEINQNDDTNNDQINYNSKNDQSIKMCNVKFQNFGISKNKLLKYKDLHYIYPKFYIDRKLSDGKQCTNDADCNHYDCLTECDVVKQQCVNPQRNNNLQIVCDKIFKGTLRAPGLLLSKRTPQSLATILDKCINSTNFKNVSNEMLQLNDLQIKNIELRKIRESLYDELTYLYESLSVYQH